jgi:hypothetical protein
MVVRTPVKITSGEQYKQDIERELSNFVKRENEFMARERQERAEQLGLAFERDHELTATIQRPPKLAASFIRGYKP